MVTDTVNKIDMFNFDVCMSSGMTFGWGSRQKSSLKNVFDENFSRNYLSQYLQKLVIATVRQGKDYGHLFRGLVNRNEANLVWGYGSNHMAHFSVVNISIIPPALYSTILFHYLFENSCSDNDLLEVSLYLHYRVMLVIPLLSKREI